MFEHKKIDSKNRRTYETKKLIKIIYKDYYKTIKKEWETILNSFIELIL